MGRMSARLDGVRPLLCGGAFMALRVALREGARSVGPRRSLTSSFLRHGPSACEPSSSATTIGIGSDRPRREDEGDLDTEMVAIAGAIIRQRTGNFNPSTYHDRYQEALQQLIEAKMKGVTIEARAVPTPSPVIVVRVG
jgi:hypothetical protein